MEIKVLQIIAFIIVIILIFANIIESLFLHFRKKEKEARSTRIAASIIGMISGLIGALHGCGEILHRNTKMVGFLFEANTGRSLTNLPTSEWTGWIAITVIPNFLMTGIIIIIISIIIINWALFFIRIKKGGLILIFLSLALIPFGGGFVPPVLGIIAGIIGLRIKHL